VFALSFAHINNTNNNNNNNNNNGGADKGDWQVNDHHPQVTQRRLFTCSSSCLWHYREETRSILRIRLLPSSSVNFKGAYFKASTSKERGRERDAKMIYTLGREKPLCCHCSSEVGQGALEHWFVGGHNLKLLHCVKYVLLIVGAGYQLTIVKDSTCDSAAVTDVIQSYVAGALRHSDISAELSYILPQDSKASFSQLFARLDKDKEALGIVSYGASVTTMDEVFIRLTCYYAE